MKLLDNILRLAGDLSERLPAHNKTVFGAYSRPWNIVGSYFFLAVFTTIGGPYVMILGFMTAQSTAQRLYAVVMGLLLPLAGYLALKAIPEQQEDMPRTPYSILLGIVWLLVFAISFLHPSDPLGTVKR